MATLGIDEAIGECSPGRLIRQINKLIERRVQALLADSDQSFEEWMALKLISDGVVEHAGDLSRAFGIGTGATTRLIDSLEHQGLVERDRIRDDRRVVLVKLTDLGKTHYRNKLPDMIGCWNDLLRDFEQEEVDQLVTLLSKLQAAFVREVGSNQQRDKVAVAAAK